MPACGSPRLIAACHVLRRLLAPRHPPYALSSLTIKLTQHVARRSRVAPFAPRIHAGRVRLSTFSTVADFSSRTCGAHQALIRLDAPFLPASFSCLKAPYPSPFPRERRHRSWRWAVLVWSHSSQTQKTRRRAPGISAALLSGSTRCSLPITP